MITQQQQEWKKMAPLIYSYISTVPVPVFSSISSAIFTKPDQKVFFKFEEYKVILCGQSQSQTGLITVNKLLAPQTKDLNDERVRPVLNKQGELHFETQVTIFDQYFPRESIGNSQQSYLLVCQRKKPELYVYQFKALQKNRERTGVNPRLTFKGHQCEITALKCRKDEIISGSVSGEIRIHNIKQGEQQASVTYKYHRQKITDCLWLTRSQGSDNEFITSSLDGLIYMWDKRQSLPASKIEPKQKEVNCLQLLKDYCFLSGGKDGTIKFYDIRAGNNKHFAFKEHTAGVTKIKKIEGRDIKEGCQPVHQILFASGSLNGEVFLWGEQLQFVHLAHKSEITSIAFDLPTEYFLSLEKKSTELNIWKPTIFNYQ